MSGHGAICDFCDRPYWTTRWAAPWMCFECTRTRDFMLWNPAYLPKHWAVIPA